MLNDTLLPSPVFHSKHEIWYMVKLEIFLRDKNIEDTLKYFGYYQFCSTLLFVLKKIERNRNSAKKWKGLLYKEVFYVTVTKQSLMSCTDDGNADL